ncbi:hypothetical protein, partial [Roseisolibacter sp. H3M3-2]|uniref:hypothetical protein n=1 Tax=Roseisolibacter sp. H3M3-2 TaxID=3031323 RepID=UPI0023D9A99D
MPARRTTCSALLLLAACAAGERSAAVPAVPQSSSGAVGDSASGAPRVVVEAALDAARATAVDSTPVA